MKNLKNILPTTGSLLARGCAAVMMCLVLMGSAFGQQEIHFSQYMFNGLLINPAYAGSRQQASINLMARSQWVGFPGAPKSQTVSLHAPSRNMRHGYGFLLSNDAIGPVNNTGLSVQYAFRIPLDDEFESSLSLGLQGGFDAYRTNFQSLRLDDQTDETLVNNDVNRVLPNAGFGMYYQRPRFFAGVGIPRLIRNHLTNDKSTSDARQWRHYFVNSGLLLDFSQNIKFRPSLLFKHVNGAGSSLDVNASVIFKDLFWIGASWRTEDAVVLMAEIWPTKQLRLGYAYDINTSGLQDFNRGSHEISLGFDFNFWKDGVISPRYF